MGVELRNQQGLNESEFLAAYTPGDYERPSVTVDMVIFTVAEEETKNYRRLPEKALNLLMIQRGDHPCIGQWALPGGFVNMNESLEDAARRELKEETNIEDIYMEQLYTWGDVGRDPRTRIISCSYLSLVDKEHLDVKSGDDAADAGWFTVTSRVFREEKQVIENGSLHQQWFRLQLAGKEITLSAIVKTTKTVIGKVARIQREVVESDNIAFDHALVIHYGVERLRSKIAYTDMAFNLMGELFTLTELQQVYEIILDEELLKANFRRKIAGRVLETNEYRKDAGHRPSKLYRFNPDWTQTLE